MAEVTSAGTLIAAVMETTGYLTQSAILDRFELFFSRAAGLVYLIGGVGGLISMVLFGSFRASTYLLVGPGLFLLALEQRTEIDGADYQMGRDNAVEATVRAERVRAVIKDSGRRFSDDELPQVSSLFWWIIKPINKTVSKATETILNFQRPYKMVFTRTNALVNLAQGSVSDPAVIDGSIELFTKCNGPMNRALTLSSGRLNDRYLKRFERLTDLAVVDGIAGNQFEERELMQKRAFYLQQLASMMGEELQGDDLDRKVAPYSSLLERSSTNVKPPIVLVNVDHSRALISKYRDTVPEVITCRELWNYLRKGILEVSARAVLQVVENSVDDIANGRTPQGGDEFCRVLLPKLGSVSAPLPAELAERSDLTENCKRVAHLSAIFQMRRLLSKETVGLYLKNLEGREQFSAVLRRRIFIEAPSGFNEADWEIVSGTASQGLQIIKGNLSDPSKLQEDATNGLPITIEDPVRQSRFSGPGAASGLFSMSAGVLGGQVLVRRKNGAKGTLGVDGLEEGPYRWVGYGVALDGASDIEAAFYAYRQVRIQGLKQELYTWSLQIPYYQGLCLYMISIAYPFLALMLLIPGRAMAFVSVFLTWFWVKSWDIGFAMVMVFEQVLWNVLDPRGIGDDVFSESLPAYHTLLAAVQEATGIDLYEGHYTYYMLLSISLLSVPGITGYAILKGKKSILGSFTAGPGRSAKEAGSRAEGTFGMALNADISNMDQLSDGLAARRIQNQGFGAGSRGDSAHALALAVSLPGSVQPAARTAISLALAGASGNIAALPGVIRQASNTASKFGETYLKNHQKITTAAFKRDHYEATNFTAPYGTFSPNRNRVRAFRMAMIPGDTEDAIHDPMMTSVDARIKYYLAQVETMQEGFEEQFKLLHGAQVMGKARALVAAWNQLLLPSSLGGSLTGDTAGITQRLNEEFQNFHELLSPEQRKTIYRKIFMQNIKIASKIMKKKKELKATLADGSPDEVRRNNYLYNTFQITTDFTDDAKLALGRNKAVVSVDPETAWGMIKSGQMGDGTTNREFREMIVGRDPDKDPLKKDRQ